MRPVWGAALVGWLRSFQRAGARVKVWSELWVWRWKWVGSFQAWRRSRHIEASNEATLRIRKQWCPGMRHDQSLLTVPRTSSGCPGLALLFSPLCPVEFSKLWPLPCVWPSPAAVSHSSLSIVGEKPSASGFWSLVLARALEAHGPRSVFSQLTFLGLGSMTTHGMTPQWRARGSSCPPPVPCAPLDTHLAFLIPQMSAILLPLDGTGKVGFVCLCFCFFSDGIELTLTSVLPLRHTPAPLKSDLHSNYTTIYQALTVS